MIVIKPEKIIGITLKGISMIDYRKLVTAGVHFGHQKSRWSPKMAPYIWGYKNGVHLIDVSKTASQLEKAAQFLEKVASNGKSILWVGTKKPAQNIVYETATQLKMPYVNHRWIGGTLSNHIQVKKSLTKWLHYEDILARSEKFPHYTKKELNTIQKASDRLQKNIGGLKGLAWPVGALVLIDVRKEQSALKEANRMGVPVVGLVDTNNDPSMVDYVIPGNDDAPRAIRAIVEYLAQAAERGKQAAAAAKIAQTEEVSEIVEPSMDQIRLTLEEEEEEARRKSAAAKNKRPKKFVEEEGAKASKTQKK